MWTPEISSVDQSPKGNEIHRLDRLSLSTDGVFIVDREKRITSFSEKVERITGHAFHEIAGRPCSEVFHADLCRKGCLVDDTLLSGNAYTNIFVTIRKKDGTPSMISTTITPLKDIKGRIAGAIITFKDMAEIDSFFQELRERMEEVLIERNRFHALIDHLDEGVFSVDRSWRITSFNGSALQLTGYERKDVIGKDCRSVLRGSHCESDCILEKALYLGEALSGVQGEVQDRNGKAVPVLITVIPFFDPKGKFAGGLEALKSPSLPVVFGTAPIEMAGSKSRGSAMEVLEKDLILRGLQECHWNRTETAKRLGMSPVTLWRKMKRYGLHR